MKIWFHWFTKKDRWVPIWKGRNKKTFWYLHIHGRGPKQFWRDQYQFSFRFLDIKWAHAPLTQNKDNCFLRLQCCYLYLFELLEHLFWKCKITFWNNVYTRLIFIGSLYVIFFFSWFLHWLFRNVIFYISE